MVSPASPFNTLGRNVLSINMSNMYGIMYLINLLKFKIIQVPEIVALTRDQSITPLISMSRVEALHRILRPNNVESFTCFASCERLKHVIIDQLLNDQYHDARTTYTKDLVVVRVGYESYCDRVQYIRYEKLSLKSA